MSTILLAEDDRISRVMLQAVLMKWGHQVVSVGNGREALERLMDPEGPSLAILDWIMPELSGLDVCRSVRKAVGLRPIHLILLTAKSKGAETAEALDAGADDHLSKPYELVELQARLQLGIRRLQSSNAAGSKVGVGQDQMLKRILTHFLSLNRIALDVVLEDPSQLGIPAIRQGRCDISHVVREVVTLASGFLSDHISVSVNGEATETGVSEETLRQILQNLILHVRMAAGDRPGRLDIFWHHGMDCVMLCCEDDGPSVLPEDITLLAWPVTTLRNQAANPGFGLFFANLLAESAGGSISCSSPAGRGLRIEVRLPTA
jgi:DNA-binding response OmpR family regulator